MNFAFSSVTLASGIMLLLAGCGGGAVGGADDAVALARGTTTTDSGTLNTCLPPAGYNVKDASAAAEEVEVRTLSNGDKYHLVTFTSPTDEIRLTVVTDSRLVFAYDDGAATLLEKAGCAIDGKPLH